MSKLQSFLANYEKEKTKKTFVWVLGVFSKSVYGDKKNLDEKMDQYLSEKRDHEKDVEDFYISLNGKPPLSKRLMVSNLKTFLADYDIELSNKFWKRLRERNKVANRAVSFDEVPEQEQLRKIFTHLNAKGKALFGILTSSGMRIGETLKLLLNDIDFTTKPTTIRIPAETTKTGSSRTVFISSEATDALLEWLRIREKSIETIIARTNRKRKVKINRNRVFPFEFPNAQVMWVNALKSAGLAKRDSTTGRYIFHIHVLRKFFRTQMATVIPVDIVEALMGHEGYLTSVYRKYTVKQLREFYQKSEYTVGIFQDTAKVMKLKKEIDKTKQELSQHNRSLRIQIDNVRAKNIEQETQITGLKVEFNNFKERLESATELIYSFEPVLNTFSAIADTPEGQELILKIKEAKLKQETVEAQEETEKLKADVTKEHPISKAEISQKILKVKKNN